MQAFLYTNNNHCHKAIMQICITINKGRQMMVFFPYIIHAAHFKHQTKTHLYALCASLCLLSRSQTL